VLQLCLIPQGESSILVLIFGAFVFSPMVFASIIAFPTRETFDATLIGLLSFLLALDGPHPVLLSSTPYQQRP
jgi:hypothetical protein